MPHQAGSHNTASADEAVSADRFHEAIATLRRVVREPALFDGVASQTELSALLRQARSAQADLAALVTRIGVVADRLADRGRSAPATEVLLDQGQVRGHTARAEAARAAVVGWAPGVADAVTGGRVGADQLDSLARHTQHLDEAERERLPVAELIVDAERLPADTFDRQVRRAVNALGAQQARADAERKRAASALRHWYDDRSGMGRISGQLDPERYEAFASALDGHVGRMASRSPEATERNANLAAAALVELVTARGAGDGRRPIPMSVVVDVRTLAAARSHAAQPGVRAPQAVGRSGDGRELSDDALARLSCDAELRRVVLDERSVPIDVGRIHRTATDAQWSALRARHPGCAWPGCERPMSRCQIHHIRPWSAGGPTDLANLVPLCGEHHHRVHEGEWTISLTPERELRIWRPDGVEHRSRAGPPRERARPLRERGGRSEAMCGDPPMVSSSIAKVDGESDASRVT